jgi:pimeloyl-ACP methyl ester carboxylesterase
MNYTQAARNLPPHRYLSNGLGYLDVGEGPPLLCLHGFSMPGVLFLPLIEALKHQFRLLVPDMRGHGHSMNLPSARSMYDYASDMTLLGQELGLAQVNVLGYSMGGAVAQALTFQSPAFVERLILCCTFAYKHVTLSEQLAPILGKPILRLLGPKGLAAFIRPAISRDRATRETLQGWLQDTVRQNNATQHLVAGAEAIFHFDARPHLPHIQQPTLILAGDLDPVVPPKHAHILARLIPHARLIMLPGATHAFIYTHTAMMKGAIEHFLEAQAPES